MSGQPKKRAMIAELTRRAAEELEDGEKHLEYVVQWVEAGKTITELAKDIGVDCTPEMISRYLYKTWPDTAGVALAKARSQGAHGMVDRALEILDDAPTHDREHLTKAKMRADGRLWVAERWNKNELGRSPDTVVNINHNTLHLDAMRKRALTSERDRNLPTHARAFIMSQNDTPPETSTIASAIDAELVEAIPLPAQDIGEGSSGL